MMDSLGRDLVAYAVLMALIALAGSIAYHAGGALADLVVEFMVMLGALDHVDGMRPDGAPITGAAMPKQWLARLEKAVVVGAFERLTVSEIVTRILTTEAEGA